MHKKKSLLHLTKQQWRWWWYADCLSLVLNFCSWLDQQQPGAFHCHCPSVLCRGFQGWCRLGCIGRQTSVRPSICLSSILADIGIFHFNCISDGPTKNTTAKNSSIREYISASFVISFCNNFISQSLEKWCRWCLSFRQMSRIFPPEGL